MSDILSSKGLLERIDLRTDKETLVILKFSDFEFTGVFSELNKTLSGIEVSFSLKKDDLVFKIFKYKQMEVIIKNGTNNMKLSMSVDGCKIKNINNSSNLLLVLEAKEYEIQTV